MKTTKIKKQVDELLTKLYGSDFSNTNRKYVIANKGKMENLLAPIGSLIVTPQSMSKKDFDAIQLQWVKAIQSKLDKKKIIVVVSPAREHASGVTARPLGTNDKALTLWFQPKYPKALASWNSLKRIVGTKWKAVRSKNGWDAIELVK